MNRPSPRACFCRAVVVAACLLLGALSGCAVLPPHGSARTPSSSIALAPDTPLGRLAIASTPPGTSAFRPLPQSAFSMDARLTLIAHAERSVDLQYYLLQDDVTGHKLLRAVRDAALRGVRVRILVDDLYTSSSDDMLDELAAYPNVEIRLFNPFPAGRTATIARWTFALEDFSRLNHRMHNKMMIVDGAFAIAGGRNIADEYFFSSKTGNFIDFDLLLAGEVIPHLAAIFDTYWNSPRVYRLDTIQPSGISKADAQRAFDDRSRDAVAAYPTPTQADLLGNLPLSTDLAHTPLKMMSGHIEAFADDPEKVSGRAEGGNDPTTVTARVTRAIASAQSEVVLGSPYFIPGPVGLAGLRAATARGVRVEVITNALGSNDEPLASAAYARYRVPMLQAGVEIYETASPELHRDSLIGKSLGDSVGRSHSKLIVIDRHVTFVGSMNLDLRSSRLNTELGMLIDSPELAQAVHTLADRVRSIGSYRLQLAPDGHLQWVANEELHSTVYDSEPDLDFGTHLQMLLLSPFISESLL